MTLHKENGATYSVFQFTDLSLQGLLLTDKPLLIHDDLSIVILNPVGTLTAVIIVLGELAFQQPLLYF